MSNSVKCCTRCIYGEQPLEVEPCDTCLDSFFRYSEFESFPIPLKELTSND